MILCDVNTTTQNLNAEKSGDGVLNVNNGLFESFFCKFLQPKIKEIFGEYFSLESFFFCTFIFPGFCANEYNPPK